MAIIKASNLLSSKPTAKKVNLNKFFASSKKVDKTVQVNKKSDDLRNELINIKEKVINIDKLVKSTFIFQKNISEQSRKEREKDQRSTREKKLESYKSKIPGLEFPSLPKFDFIESIKRFIFFTFLGAAFPKLLEIVPKLVQLGNLIAPAVNFFVDIAKGLANGLVTFIDWGYKIRDNAEKVTKQISGENAAKKFNEFNRSLNTFIDLSILAGLAALDAGLDAQKLRKQQLEKEKIKAKPRKLGISEGRGGAKDLGRRAEVTTGKGGARGLGKRAAVTVGEESKGALKNLKGPFAKLKGPLSKFAGAAVPGLGAAVGAADAAARFAAGDNVGGTLASVSAALDALTAGTAILAATGIGAAVPAAFATVSMGIDAVLLIRDIVKVFFPQIPMFAGGGRIKLMAQGGRVGSSGRSIKVSRKKINIGKPQDTRPGKDVGGKQQILKLFPDGSPENIRQTTSASPWWAKLFGGGNKQTAQVFGGKRPSPYKAIESTSKSLKKIPIPFISALMGAGSDLNLGQKPDKNLGDIVGGSIGKLTQDIIDNNMKLSFSDVVRFVSGYANGGDIKSGDIIKENDIGYQVGSMVSKVINTAISSRVDEAITGILREITGQGKPPEEGGGGAGGGAGNIAVSSDQPDFWLLATAALFENSSPQGAADVAQAIYNRVAMPGDPWKTNGSIRTAILSPGQFQPVRDYGGYSAWGRIRDKQSAISFVQSQGKSQSQLEDVSSALLNTTRQRSAKTFVGPRDSFRAVSYENKHNDLANDTQVVREGHVFGFEPKGATIANFRSGKLRPAEINRSIIQGTVSAGPGGNLINVGKMILQQGFTVGENKFFTNNAWSKFEPNPGGFNPRGNSPVGGHASADHSTNAFDVTDHRGQPPQNRGEISRLTNLFLHLYQNRNQYGIKALIYDHYGYWFVGQKSITRGKYDGNHYDHLHVGFTRGAYDVPKQQPATPNLRPAARPAQSSNPSGAVTGYGKVLDTEYFYANGKYWQRQNGISKEIDYRTYAAIRTNHSTDFGIAPGVDANKLKLPGGGYRPQGDISSIISTPNQSQKSQGLDYPPSYAEGSSSFIAIQLVKQDRIISTTA
jgi:hypothetical protein